jgi:predicted ATPase
MLAIVTARPDFTPPWLERPQASLLTLGRLGRAECAQLVAAVAAEHGLPPETVAAIVAKTDGVPLFVEELTKSVLDQIPKGGSVYWDYFIVTPEGQELKKLGMPFHP